MACELDIFDAAQLSATSPDDDDILMFLLPNKTVVFRTWANVKTALVPDDINWLIAPGADPTRLNAGEASIILPQFIGFRVRVIRNGVNQAPFAIPNGSYYNRDIATGEFNFTPAVETDELIQIQPY